MIFRSRIKRLAGVALWAIAAPALAQTVPAGAPQADGDVDMEIITVTGTRIKGNFEAPTPVQSIGTELIDQRGTTNVANVINEIPAFTGTLTPASTNLNSRQNGVNVVDLRGLGTNRNLVLVNGRRSTPFDEFENVDLNVVPSLAIERVDVVTGGASAAYGSDAVSGVINLIYNERLDELKLNAQYGISDRGDAANLRLSGAWGSFFDEGRGHILLAADYDDNKGIPKANARGWQRRSPAIVSNPADTDGDSDNPSDGIPAFMFRDNAVLFIASPNGVTLPGGPVGNLEFFSDGVARPRILGDVYGTFMSGGSGSRLADQTALVVPTERFNVLAAVSYEVAGGVEAFGEASFARSKSRGALVNAFSFGGDRGLVIKPENPYLPADVAALGQSFTLYRTFEEFDPITSASRTESMRFVGGLKGEFGSNWSWEVSAQYGQTDFSNKQYNNLLVDNLVKAADAVQVGDDIVCRVNADADPLNNDAACVPINVFGKGSPSQGAIDYITDTGVSKTRIKQTVFSAEIGGELFEGWAGPILATVGGEHRKQKLHRTANAPNDNEEFLIVNAQPLDGKYDVTEGFAEVVIPLLAGDQRLDFNGAARYTHYSTVGNVVTWKAGLTFDPIDILRFRGTISRDIRAPSIGETFVETVLLFGNLSNPFDPGSGTSLVRVPLSGNVNLSEESALTKTLGAVLSLGSFRASIDYWDINLKDAIGSLSPQDVVNRCFAGETDICSLITFGPDDSLFEVRQQNLNLGTYKLRGLDFEARYSTELGNGTLGLGAVASYLIHKKIAPSGGTPLDVAGELGGRNAGGMPDFKATLSANYEAERWGAFVQARYIDGGVYDVTFGPEDLSNEDNNVGSVIYVDMSVKFKFESANGKGTEIYAGVDNLFDRTPPVLPVDFISNSATNASIYDVIGRKYYVGVRARF
ncbi:outer membrane receptor protein involved in Fe transport [Sphingosinicella soli]|uniref:Outer membrane receptor protein involved in Fe transport n=1 Tax=Sphingosinicella soli TaxID=333708 RepID=A0A7W7F6Y8_9SPHN|nr:outer membrane receptor protein involved in Fe transport [Sphingosinicella soli]